jgi:hypothetical protein
MNRPATWTLDEAKSLLRRYGPVFTSAGFTCSVVGSVAQRGWSDNDLDVLLEPLTALTLDQGIDRLERLVLPVIGASDPRLKQKHHRTLRRWDATGEVND